MPVDTTEKPSMKLYKSEEGLEKIMSWYEKVKSEINVEHESIFATTRFGKTHAIVAFGEVTGHKHQVNMKDMAKEAAMELVNLGAAAAVVKGGHMHEGPATDILYDGSEFRLFTTKRVNTPNTHGTGCTFASAISAQLAKGSTVREAVSCAKTYVTGAIINGLNIGSGHGPLNHFYQSRHGL